jgi:hypothetical protein
MNLDRSMQKNENPFLYEIGQKLLEFFLENKFEKKFFLVKILKF